MKIFALSICSYSDVINPLMPQLTDGAAAGP